jgi:DNA-binding MarR family transcriptional regulator
VKLLLEETYLYKFRLLTNGLDKLFDTELRKHADIGLSHFLILVTVRQHKNMSAKDIAAFLAISPAAVSRQIESARISGWLDVTDLKTDKRGQSIRLTREGEKQVRKGLKALEVHVFSIFIGGKRQTDLMSHIDILMHNMRGDEL